MNLSENPERKSYDTLHFFELFAEAFAATAEARALRVSALGPTAASRAMDGSEPPPQVEDTAEWDGLSPEDRQGMLLAIEARTLGSRGQKHGNDVGAVLVRPSGGAEGEDHWRVVSWGCARTLTSAPASGPEAPLEDAGDGTGAPKTKKRKTKGGDNKIDIHAEMDAVAHAARRGVSVEGCAAFITRSPCNRCLPLLVAAGVTRIVYGDAIREHTSPEGAERQAKIAAEHAVNLTENVPPAPRGAAPYARWLEGEDTKLFPRPEVWKPTSGGR